MSGTATVAASSPERDAWVQKVFGVHPATFEAAKVANGAAAGAPAKAGAAKPGAVEPGGQVPPDDKAMVKAAIVRLDAQVGRLEKAEIPTTGYKEEEARLFSALTAADAEKDAAKRKKALAALLLAANGLAARAKADADGQLASVVEGVGKAAASLRDGAKAQIDKLDKKNAEKAGLEARLKALDDAIAAAGKEADRLRKSKLLASVDDRAQGLFDDAAKASGDRKAVQATYQQALKDRYGLNVNNPNKTKNTHFDGVYKMFDKVPVSDVVQDKLKKFTYYGKAGESGAAYGGAEIFMGEYGNEDWGYQDPATGSKTPLNGFNISTLHELGHSVDDRYGIMSAHQSKPGGGGWKKESADSTAAAALAEFKKGAGKALKATDDVLLGLIARTLKSTPPKPPKKGQPAPPDPAEKKPKGMSDDDWKAVAPFLQQCYSVRSHKNPWFNAPPSFGGRTYQESYPGEWWSYDPAARAKNTVRNYQWRAPGEWFAELYAYSFYNSKKAPPGVEGAIAAYMFGGKAEAKAAPAAQKH